MVDIVIEKKVNVDELPLIGFGTEFNNDKIKGIAEQIMEQEEINQRDFIIKQIPELSAEGVDRPVYMEVKEFKVLNVTKDNVTVSFSLKKGQYATEVVRQILS